VNAVYWLQILKMKEEKRMNVVSVDAYTKTSKQIEKEKNKVFNTLAALHDDLCELAQLERDLEAERVQGVTHVRGFAHNAPELVEHINAANRQLVLPTQKVWSLVDSAIAIVDASNKSAMNGSVDQLPEVFKRTDRIEEFKKGKG